MDLRGGTSYAIRALTTAASCQLCRSASIADPCGLTLISLSAMVRLVAEFLEKLDLRDVTLVGNDWGGAQLLDECCVDWSGCRKGPS